MTTEVKQLDRNFTAEEFENLPEFDKGYELLDGKLVKKPMPVQEHSLIARILQKNYDRFDPDENVGQLLQEISVTLGPKNVPAPDLAFWKATRKPACSKKAAPLPDLAIEILSPRDLETKKRREEVQDKIKKYQAAGVSFVWVIDPEAQTVEIYRPDKADPVQTLTINGELDGEDIIPGFNLAVKILFQ